MYCRAEMVPGDPESIECDLQHDDPHDDPHESGVHMRHDATGGVSVEWDAIRCDICGEWMGPYQEQAEMYDPASLSSTVFAANAQCGISADLDVA